MQQAPRRNIAGEPLRGWKVVAATFLKRKNAFGDPPLARRRPLETLEGRPLDAVLCMLNSKKSSEPIVCQTNGFG